MTAPNAPKVNIPKYEVPVGQIMTVKNREGLLTYEKQADGWEVIGFEAAHFPEISS